jgi:hypothetical protein
MEILYLYYARYIEVLRFSDVTRVSPRWWHFERNYAYKHGINIYRLLAITCSNYSENSLNMPRYSANTCLKDHICMARIALSAILV